MPRAQYLEVEAALRSYLDQKLEGAYRIPRYYGDKADFGDLDVIVPARPDWGELRKELARELGVVETKAVGHVYSMSFRALQTDFFAVAPIDLESTYNFMCFNDLGNLLGKMCRRFNLKYGERGLSYVYRREKHEHYKAELPLTRDFERISNFLGLDYAAWHKGFAKLEHVFDWAIASPYFSVAPYLDDLEGGMKKRSAQRTTVQRFLDYLKTRNIDRRPTFRDRHTYLPELLAAFPEANLETQVAQERERELRAYALAEKFNGTIVMNLHPHLQGRALSEFMNAFKNSIPNFETYLLTANPEDLEKRIRDFEFPPGTSSTEISD